MHTDERNWEVQSSMNRPKDHLMADIMIAKWFSKRGLYRFASTCSLMISALVASASVTGAAEVRLKASCKPAGSVVVLGDVAEILSNNTSERNQLASAELVPSPPAGETRYLRLREIQDLLDARGVNRYLHRFSGASQVAIKGGGRVSLAHHSVSSAAARGVADRVSQAIAQHLKAHVADRPWHIEVELTNEQINRIVAARTELTAEGGAAPWVGLQQFALRTATESSQPIVVQARVTLPVSVVVALRSLPRGTIIQATDVQLQPGPVEQASHRRAQYFNDLENVIGLETTQAVAAGNFLDTDAVQRPILVKRGEVVSVDARSSGVRVRTTARARESGSAGDLVEVESILNRKRYYARVTGIQEVDVLAEPVRAADQQTLTPSRLR